MLVAAVVALSGAVVATGTDGARSRSSLYERVWAIAVQ